MQDTVDVDCSRLRRPGARNCAWLRDRCVHFSCQDSVADRLNDAAIDFTSRVGPAKKPVPEVHNDVGVVPTVAIEQHAVHSHLPTVATLQDQVREPTLHRGNVQKLLLTSVYKSFLGGGERVSLLDEDKHLQD